MEVFQEFNHLLIFDYLNVMISEPQKQKRECFL